MISEFLFYEDDVDKTEKSNYIRLKIEIRDLLREDFNRKILSQILIDLRKDVSGDTQKRLFKLYQDLALEKDAFEKLESWRWEVISKGILELTLMQVEEAYPFIVKFINDRRGTIRKQAEIATISLKPGGISYFLDTTKYKISEWQQLKLLDVLRNKEDFEPPRFKVWLTSTNTHVVLFALRLIKYYNQNDANASLIELVKHKGRQVKQQAIQCIKEFHVTEALPTLKGVFPKCSVDIKLEILGAIAELGNTSDIEFLETVSQREGNFSVKSKAVGAINTIAPESVMPTENIEFVKTYQKPKDLRDEDASIHDRQVLQTGNDSLLKDSYTSQIVDFEEGLKNISQEETANFEQAREGPEMDISMEQPATSDSEPEPMNECIPNNHLPKITTPMNHPKKSDKPLKEIEVEIEEVKAASSEETITTGTASEDTDKTGVSHFDISEIHFLPLVVANETEELLNENWSVPDNEISAEALKDIEVYHEEILSHPMDKELQALISEIHELDFLPIVIDDVILPYADPDINSETDAPDEADPATSKSLEGLEGYSLSDFEISFEEKDVAKVSGEYRTVENGTMEDKIVEEETAESETVEDETVEFDLEDAPIIDVANPNLEDVMSWLMADNELREIEMNYETVPYSADTEISSGLIPEPVYYDEHEAYMMGLLDDLEELGDLREIPLLEELRAEESKSFIKERITAMIEKFATERVSKRKTSSTNEDLTTDLPVFSVFADLFKNIDTECKLILLDEIVPVGDEKEIEFLDGLLDNPDQRIRNKAQTVLKLLIAKLSHEKPQALTTKGVCDIVAEQVANATNLKEENFDHLLSELELSPAVAPEIFNIDFELCEILDKNYDQKILDIPVIATEVSPNDNGGSFFKSLKNITKMFF